jgi:hypothetical protein
MSPSWHRVTKPLNSSERFRSHDWLRHRQRSTEYEREEKRRFEIYQKLEAERLAREAAASKITASTLLSKNHPNGE